MDSTASGTPIAIRTLAADDLDSVVDLSLRAWAPVFASFAEVLGSTIYSRVYPDWSTGQAQAVRDVCAGDHVFVADVGGAVAGFAAVVIRDDDPRTGEIDMIAVDPEYQRLGVGSALIEHSVDHLRRAGAVLVDVATGGDLGHAPARRAMKRPGSPRCPLSATTERSSRSLSGLLRARTGRPQRFDVDSPLDE